MGILPREFFHKLGPTYIHELILSGQEKLELNESQLKNLLELTNQRIEDNFEGIQIQNSIEPINDEIFIHR